ncbi:arylsulfatase domain protein [Olsenella profusa F0195]|uniref:Arylsulfatase domain protein n=2 Tax=Olsenella profusa TaxID=138595 RepID=U2TMJ7_9ACTN|nr:arylsulfatase domain protein [Olsenella profusa F0195]
MSLLDVSFAIIVEPLRMAFVLCVTLLNRLIHSPIALCFVLGMAIAVMVVMGTFHRMGVLHSGDSIRKVQAKKRDATPPAHDRGSRPLSRVIFLASCLVLVVLTGVVIPVGLIEVMPQAVKFVGSATDSSQILALVERPLCLALGTFLLWPIILYALPGRRHRCLLEVMLVALACVAIIDYRFFGTNGEAVSMLYASDFTPAMDLTLIVANIAAVLATCVVSGFLSRRFPRITLGILTVATTAMAGSTILHATALPDKLAAAEDEVAAQKTEQPQFTLSKTGQNVVVLMLDRGMSEYIPYIMNEKPELKEQFAGFTYYPNTMSFGGFTNFGVPALFGGYEYTPVEMNKRSTERLQDKHDEALTVMPAIFDQGGYDVTVCDPPYAGYQWEPDLSIYDPYPNVHTYNTMGYFTGMASDSQQITGISCDLFYLAVARVCPLPCRQPLYASGVTYTYGDGDASGTGIPLNVSTASGQTVSDDALTADGGTDAFLQSYYALNHLTSMTRIDDSITGSFLMMANDATHDPMILQEPSYTPTQHVDNTAYEAQHHGRFTVNGEQLICENSDQYMHYQANMAALMQVGRWLDYLREQGVYDNTRIIICSDHGRPLHQLASRILPGNNGLYDTEFYAPLLMEKDFDATEFTTDEGFMTQSDVPTMATRGVISNPTNPFTGKPISNAEKYAHDQYILASWDWDISANNGTTFLPGVWFAVHTDMRVMGNWREVPDPGGQAT